MDDVLRSDVHYQEHTGVLTHKLTQPTERMILERAQDMRNTPGLLRDLGAKSEGGSWGRMVATIPNIMIEQAQRNGFELNHKDQDHASKEMFRFLQTPAGKACLVQEKI